MKNRIKEFSHLNKVGLKIALGSFSLGSLLFLAAMLFPIDLLLGLGLLFILLTGVINLILLIALFIDLIPSKNKNQNLFTMYCIIINIPIAIGYLCLLQL